MTVQFGKRSNIPYVATSTTNPYVWTQTSDKFIIYDVKDSGLYGVIKGDDIKYYDTTGEVATNGRIVYHVYGYTKDGSSIIFD